MNASTQGNSIKDSDWQPTYSRIYRRERRLRTDLIVKGYDGAALGEVEKRQYHRAIQIELRREEFGCQIVVGSPVVKGVGP